MKRKYLCCIWAITICCIVFSGYFKVVSPILSDFKEKSFSKTIILKDKSIKKIDAKLDAGDVTVKYGNELKVHYCYPKKHTPKIKVEGDSLVIRETSNIKIAKLNKAKYNIEVTIPKETKLDEIDMKVDLGDVEINDLLVDKINVDADMGDINLENVISSTCKVDVSLGDETIKNGKHNSITIDTNMGDAEVKTEFDKIKVDCNMGDIDIKTSGKLTKKNADLNCDMGDITVNGKEWDD